MNKNRSLCDLLVSELQLELRGTQIVEIAADIVKYIIGVYGSKGAYNLQHSLKNKVDFSKLEDSAKTFRLKLMETSYLSLRLKYFSINMALWPLTPENIRKFRTEFDIDRNDVVLLKKVFDLKNFRKEVRSSDRLKSLNKRHVTYEAYRNVYHLFDEIYPNVMRHIRGMTNKKLKFLTYSNNIQNSDFHCDCICKAITTFNKLMPTSQTPLYVQNYVKRAVTNHVQNIIKSFNTQKRERMIKGKPDGFGGYDYPIMVLSENQFAKNFEINYDSLEMEQSRSNSEELEDSTLNYWSLLKHYGNTKKRKEFILLMSGFRNEKFTRWLHNNKVCKNRDNEELFLRLDRKRYCKYVCEYMRIEYTTGIKFLDYIGKTAFPDEKKENLYVA